MTENYPSKLLYYEYYEPYATAQNNIEVSLPEGFYAKTIITILRLARTVVQYFYGDDRLDDYTSTRLDRETSGDAKSCMINGYKTEILTISGLTQSSYAVDLELEAHLLPISS